MPHQRRNLIRAGLFIVVAAAALAATGWYGYHAAYHLLTPLSERYRMEADVLLAEGHLPEAVLTYRQAVEADGGNFKAVRALAEAYERQGRLRMAERYRARAENRQPVYSLPPVRPENGLTPLWITPVSEAPPLGGALGAERLISSHEDGTVAAVAVATGKIIWSQKLPAAATSAPGAGETVTATGASDGNLYGLSLVDGNILWQVPTGGPIYATPLFRDGIIYCPSSSGTLLALRETDGSIIWKREFDSPMNGASAVANGRLFLGSNNGRLYALNTLDGSLAWPDGVLTGGAVESEPIVIENRVMVGSGDGRVYAFDALSGGQYWRASTPDAVYARPLALEERVYVASSGRSLSAVDLATGERIWQILLPAPLRSAPAAAENRLYLAGEGSADLFVIDRESGALLASIPTGDWIAAGPWISETMLYLLEKDGALLAYKIQ